MGRGIPLDIVVRLRFGVGLHHGITATRSVGAATTSSAGGSRLEQTQVCRDQEEVLTTGERWKAAFAEGAGQDLHRFRLRQR